MFNHLIGNKTAKETLKRMLEARRVPGALLFVGPDGVGKKLLAFEIAKSFLCRQPKNFEACGVCSSCVRVGKFVFPKSDDEIKEAKKKILWSEHPDVGLIYPVGKEILVDAMRDVEREANFRPYEGAARFFIIEKADKMRIETSNALLKTLEEPPETSHLFLITSRLNALLPTIRSRCQVIRFAPLQTEEIEQHLLKDGKLTQADARLFAHASRGSIGRALSLDMQLYKQQRDAMLQILEALAITKDLARLLRSAEELNEAKAKDEYESRLDVLETLIHDVWALSLDANDKIVNEDLKDELKNFSENIESKRAADWIMKIETLREQLAVNINRKIATDALFMSMATEFK
jgi:DNA polymerase-3 subunit delta'